MPAPSKTRAYVDVSVYGFTRLAATLGRLVLAAARRRLWRGGALVDRSGLDHHRGGGREPRRPDGLSPRLLRRAGRAAGPIVAAAAAAPRLAILALRSRRRLRRRLRRGGGRNRRPGRDRFLRGRPRLGSRLCFRLGGRRL